MALVVLGSRQVTHDFDLLGTRPDVGFGLLVDALYDWSLEVASRVDAEGMVSVTIARRRVAAAWLRRDTVESACSLDPDSGQRVDQLFDSPRPVS